MSWWDYAYSPYNVPFIRRSANDFLYNKRYLGFDPKYKKYSDAGMNISNTFGGWKRKMAVKLQKAMRGDQAGRVPVGFSDVDENLPHKPAKKNSFEKPQDQPMIGQYQQASSTICCVNLKPISLNKHGRKPMKVKKEMLEFPQYYEEYASRVLTSTANNRNFGSLFWDNVGRTTDTGGATSRVNISTTTKDLTAFNSVNQLETYFTDAGLVQPVYNNASLANYVDTPNDGNAKVVLDNQSTSLVFKNMTKNAAGAGTSYSPLYVRIWVVQAKNDIHLQDPSATKDQINSYIGDGWQQKYTTDEQIGQGRDHKLGVIWKDNVWTNDNFKTVGARKFCLTAGQEAHLEIFLNKKQCLSYQYKLSSTATNVTAGPIATYWNPVFIKKGEMRLFYDFHAGFADHTNVIVSEPGRLGVWINRKWTIYRFNPQHNVVERNQTVNVTVGDQLDDVDIAHDL